MATRGELEKSRQERSKKPEETRKKQHTAKAHADTVRKSTARAKAEESTADRNRKADAGGASYELEGSNPDKRPSRKSTRRAANRIKPDSNLRRRQTRRVRSPKSRVVARSA